MSEPAFPNWTQNHYTDQRPQGGMTLRDYFAAKAINAMLSNSENDGTQEPTLRAMFRDRRLVVDYAELAYDVADAMLAAREPK